MSKYDEIEVVEKFNPNHDALGRFASAGGGGIMRAPDRGGGSGGGAAGGKFSAKDFQGNQAVADAVNSLDKELTERGKNGIQDYRNGQYGFATLSLGKFDAVGVETKTNGDFDCYRWNGNAYKTPKYLVDARSGKRVPDYVDQVSKSADIDEVEVVEKFNPFHDARGRFSNKNGFASYSANPNTKAGAMAIARSAAAGHGKTANVHRESYGETVRQNANWLGHHNYNVGPRQTGSGTLTQRVEPKNGLAGASAHGYVWQYYNRLNNRTTGRNQPKNQQQAQKPAAQPTQQQPQKPAPAKQPQAQQKPAQQQQQPQQTAQQQNTAQTLANKVSDVYLSSGDKLAIQARGMNGSTALTHNVAKAHDQDIVVGKDISKTVDISKIRGSKAPIDKMAEAQGWNKGATVTDDLATFQKAAKKSGCVMIRSVDANYSSGESADSICKKTMTDGNAALGGNGGKCYGSGLYMVKTDFGKATGRSLGQKVSQGQAESYYYGNTQMMATVHPNAKIATPTQAKQMKYDFEYKMTVAERKKYGDYGAYIASKGYDGAQWHDSTDPRAYATIYNKTALIFYSGVT